MENCILRTAGLTKIYNHTPALDNVNIAIKRGGIYGFVGQNGAGKTTFMRMITGLSFPDKGVIELFGISDRKALAAQRQRVGCIIEAPAFYPYMTARENMEAMRIARGIPGHKAMDHVLDIVGLSDTGKKRVRDFSSGMKQRLSMAAALLGEPELLILDEPTNGLDPGSIVEVRELLLRLALERRMTILVSSHILSELYNLATNYIIIHHGRILRETTKQELDESCKKHISLLVNDVPRAATVLERNLNTRNFKIMPDNSITLYDFTNDMHRVIEALVNNQLTIKNITVAGDSLENVFINTIGGDIHA